MAVWGSRRQRQLAGDKRAGRFPRELAKAKRRGFVRRVWLPLVLAVLFVVAFLTAAIWVFTRTFAPSQLILGVVIGCTFTALLYEVRSTIREDSGSVTAELGQQGEKYTAQELRKLLGSGWKVVNHVVLKHRDIDHVLVGPGGVFAVETKWKSDPMRISPLDEWIIDAAEQCRSNARDLSLWHDLKSLGVGTVQSVVFFWGPGAAEMPALLFHEEVVIVRGALSAEWRDSLGSQQLDSATVDAAWQALERQCRVRDN